MISIDASALIAHLERSDTHHRSARATLSAQPPGLVISPITLAEVLVGAIRGNSAAAARAAMDTLGVRVEPLPADAAEQLAHLRVDTGLKLPDCCVLLAARTSGAAVWSFDQQVVTAARRVGLDVVEPVAGGNSLE